MLHTDVQRKGMLLYLAATQPSVCVRVANQKKITMQSAALTTPQTLALGRLTGINDLQMWKLRSFLKNVGKAGLKLSKSEVTRLDGAVGLKNMPDAVHDNCTLEWATTSGKGNEKKLPEQCSFWNTDLVLEVAAEVDIVVSAIFHDKPDLMAPPSLDYKAPGFEEEPGITVLFGGDHGAGACPISLKINFSSPQEREERNKLN